VRSLAVAVVLLLAAGPAGAAMYRCDGNHMTDRPIPGKTCTRLGAGGATVEAEPAADPAATPAAPTGPKVPAYKRPEPIANWKPEPPRDKRKSGNAMHALSICSTAITRCHEPGVRSLDQCYASMPVCASPNGSDGTETCCPAACAERYEAERTAGETEVVASQRALYGKPSCVAGVGAALN
jgi:hypothetical protein